MFQIQQFTRENYYKDYIDKIDEKFKKPRHNINEEDVDGIDDESKEMESGSDKSI